MKIEAHVLFTGRVQGVFFRQNTANKAEQLGLTGWVRNLSNGQVEAVFEGEEPDVQEILAWCRSDMPGPSRVDNVETNFTPFRGRYPEFIIRR